MVLGWFVGEQRCPADWVSISIAGTDRIARITRSALRNASVAPTDAGFPASYRVEMQPTDSLKPHPSLLKQDLRPTKDRLLALEKLGEAIFLQPLLITKEGLIVDGYARWLIARGQQRATMLCCARYASLQSKRPCNASCKPISARNGGTLSAVCNSLSIWSLGSERRREPTKAPGAKKSFRQN